VTYNEFKKKYFPKDYEKQKIKDMTATEVGKYFARKVLENYVSGKDECSTGH